MITYLCSHCGESASVPEETWFDSGSTLTCNKCGAETVFDLDKPEDRTKRYAVYTAAIFFVQAQDATSRGEAYNTLRAAVLALGLSK